MHHAREPASILMNLYIILYLLNKHTHNDSNIKELLSTVNLYFIPIINIDGYIDNNNIFTYVNDFQAADIRKNRRTSQEFAGCGHLKIGVDLNRNYDFQWGVDDLGSSARPCSLTYRGKSPFSEPETQTIKKFIEKHSDIKVAYNYHSYGNMLLTPFMYLRNAQEEFNKEYEKEFKIYNEFFEEADLPPYAKTGNGYKATGSSGNGEASDWMLGEKRIIAFSPEIGNNDKGSFDFYPDLDLLVDVVLKENLPPALYAIQRTSYFLRYEKLSNSFMYCDKAKAKAKAVTIDKGFAKSLCDDNLVLYESTVKLKNTGFGSHQGEFIPELLLNTALIDAALITAERDGKVIFTKEFKLIKEEEFQSVMTDRILNIDEVTLKVKVLVDKSKAQNKEQILFMLYKKITGEHKVMFNNPYMHQEFDQFVENDYKPEPDEEYTSVGIYIAIGAIILLVILGAIVVLYRKRRRSIITDHYTNMNQL
jgi:hypothetical protein